MAARLIAVALLALGLLPIANWIPGGETDPEYLARLLDWLNGLLLCAGVGALAWYVSTVRARQGAGALGDESRARPGTTIGWVSSTSEPGARIRLLDGCT